MLGKYIYCFLWDVTCDFFGYILLAVRMHDNMCVCVFSCKEGSFCFSSLHKAPLLIFHRHSHFLSTGLQSKVEWLTHFLHVIFSEKHNKSSFLKGSPSDLAGTGLSGRKPRLGSSLPQAGVTLRAPLWPWDDYGRT